MRDEKFSYRVDDASEMLGVTRVTIYKLIKSGDLTSFTIGKRRLISGDAIRSFIARQEAEASNQAA